MAKSDQPITHMEFAIWGGKVCILDPTEKHPCSGWRIYRPPSKEVLERITFKASTITEEQISLVLGNKACGSCLSGNKPRDILLPIVKNFYRENGASK